MDVADDGGAAVYGDDALGVNVAGDRGSSVDGHITLGVEGPVDHVGAAAHRDAGIGADDFSRAAHGDAAGYDQWGSGGGRGEGTGDRRAALQGYGVGQNVAGHIAGYLGRAA